MSYLVLARKYRSRQFSELVGQSHVSTTLLNAFRLNKLGQAYLFTGTRGVGKTSAARIFAKALRCEAPDSKAGGKNAGIACDQCVSCQEINNGSSMDVLEIDGASNNGVENVREIREQVKFLPSRGEKKVYIIDEVHMLSNAAFNALLKTLEEPPAHVTFLLATTEVQKIPATILSRCQRFDFKRIPLPQIFEHLTQILHKEAIIAEPEALRMIARKGEGSMRDALSTMDQALALAGKELTVAKVSEALGIVGSSFLSKLLQNLFQGNVAAALESLQQAFNSGVEMKILAVELVETLRNAVFVKVQAGDVLAEISAEEKKELAAATENTSAETLQAAFRILSLALEEISRSPLPKASLEMTLVRIANIGKLSSIPELLQRMQALEAKLGAGATSTTAPSAPMMAKPASTPSTVAPPHTGLPTWKAFVDSVTAYRPSVGTLLEHAVPVTPVESWSSSPAVILGFAPSDSFFQTQAQSKATLDALEKCIQDFTGKKLPVKIETVRNRPANAASLAEAANKQATTQIETAKKKFLEKDVVRNTKEIFGAELAGFDIDNRK